MSSPLQLPRTAAVIEAGIETGLHPGAQLYVSRAGEVLADHAFGFSAPGRPLTNRHLMAWLSASKPLAAVAFAQLWEEERCRLDDPVALHLPEFAAGGKEAVTIRHLLTHTSGIRMLDLGWPAEDWDRILARICARKLEPNWIPGGTAGYHEASSWFVLGELVQRLGGLPFAVLLRQRLLEPLGLEDTWIGMPPERWRGYGERIALNWDCAREDAPSHGWESEERHTRPSPGASGRGPMAELGRFYEMLLAEGELDGRRLLRPTTVAALTARHRVGLEDKTFRTRLDWGLGFILDSRHYGVERVPYGYGPAAGARTFGHSGYRSVVAFADPDRALAVALAWNGTPAEAAHQERVHTTLAALYADLDAV